MAILFTPVPISGTTIAEVTADSTPLNISISAYDSDNILTLTNISLILTPTYYDVTSTDGTPGTITGTYHIDLFNNTADYVEQGSSDILQTPVNVLIQNMPDFKELFQVNVDTTEFITIGIDVTATFDDLSTYNEYFTIDVYDNVPLVGDWIRNYFTTRY